MFLNCPIIETVTKCSNKWSKVYEAIVVSPPSFQNVQLVNCVITVNSAIANFHSCCYYGMTDSLTSQKISRVII